MHPDHEMIEHHRQRIAAISPALRAGYTLGYLTKALQRTHEEHQNGCADCSTCHDLEEMLALATAYALEELPMHLVRQVTGPA